MHKKKRGTTASTLLSGLAGAGKLKILAAIYDLKTGVVTYIDRTEPTHATSVRTTRRLDCIVRPGFSFCLVESRLLGLNLYSWSGLNDNHVWDA
jgi:hypothetical protein